MAEGQWERAGTVTPTNMDSHRAGGLNARSTSVGAACAGCMIAVLATTAVLARGDDIATPTAGPFDVLEWADGVVTSRNGYAVWVSIESTRHRPRIPDHGREVGPPEHGVALHVSCRAPGGGMPESFPPTPAHGGIYLDNHPEQPGAYTVWHPMHWILELAGRDEERWPVETRIKQPSRSGACSYAGAQTTPQRGQDWILICRARASSRRSPRADPSRSRSTHRGCGSPHGSPHRATRNARLRSCARRARSCPERDNGVWIEKCHGQSPGATLDHSHGRILKL